MNGRSEDRAVRDDNGDDDDNRGPYNAHRRLVREELESLNKEVKDLKNRMEKAQLAIWRIEDRQTNREERLTALERQAREQKPSSNGHSLFSDQTIIKILVALGAVIITLVTGKVVNFGG